MTLISNCESPPFYIVISDKTYTCEQVNCRLGQESSQVLTVKITSSETISYGRAELRLADCMLINNFTGYPVTDIIGPIGPASTEQKAAEGLGTSMGAAMASSNIALAASSLTSAFRGDLLRSQMVLLRTLVGAAIVKPETVLRSVSTLAQAFPVGNPFTGWAKSDQCEAASHLARMEIRCSFLGNFGENLTITTAIGMLSLFISISTYLVLKRMSDKHKRTKAALAWIGNNYGMAFLYAKIESSHFEITFFGFYNLVRSNRNTVMVVGDLISLILLLYTWIAMFVYGYLSIWLWNELQSNKTVSNTNQEKPSNPEDSQLPLRSIPIENLEEIKASETSTPSKTVVELVDSSKLHWSIRPFLFVYSDYRRPAKFHYLLGGVFQGIKNLVQTFCLLALTNEPAGQALAVLVCEVGYLIHYLISRSKASVSLMLTEISTQVCFIAYILLKAIAGIESLSDDTRQGGIGTAMAVFVLLSVGISLAFAAYSILVSIVQIVKSIVSMIKKKRINRVENKPIAITPERLQEVIIPNNINQMVSANEQAPRNPIANSSPLRSGIRQRNVSKKKQSRA